MNTIGFFICWVVIGIFAVWKVGDVASNWQKQTFTSEEYERVERNCPKWSDCIEKVRCADMRAKILFTTLMSIAGVLLILTWPLTVAMEFVIRKHYARED